MAVNSENELKWEIGTSEPLTIMGAEMEESQFGSKFVVRIKPLILGHDHFIPAPGLKKKIEEANVDVGDVITVEKFAPTDKYQYGYFSVNVVDKGKGPQIAKDRAEESPVQKDVKHKSVEKFEEQFEPRNINIIVHELTSRVDKLEKMVTTLSGDVGHKPGDEDIPF